MTQATQWFAPRRQLAARPRLALSIMSFVLPLLVWSLVSYVPWIWHPQVEISEPGSVAYFKSGQLVDKELFASEAAKAREAGEAQPRGTPANPVYLPAPQREVAARKPG